MVLIWYRFIYLCVGNVCLSVTLSIEIVYNYGYISGDIGLTLWVVLVAKRRGFVGWNLAETRQVPWDQHSTGVWTAWILRAGSAGLWTGWF